MLIPNEAVKALDDWLEPIQPIVTVGIVIIIAFATWLLFQTDPKVRTGWFLWLALP